MIQGKQWGNFNEMVIVCNDTTFYKELKDKSNKEFQGYTLDGYLKDNIDNYLIKAVKKKWDGVLLFTGMEGSGKTTLAGACARYIDPNFTIDNVVFTVNQFFEAVDKAPPESVILWDEMVFGGLSTEALTSVQTALIKKMTTIRKKRLYIFLVIPSIFLLRMYFAIFRTRAMIDCYTDDGIERGRFKFYSFETKRKLFFLGKKTWNMHCIKSDFYGSFTNTDGLFYDLKEYDDKKESAIKSINDKDVKEDGTPTQRLKEKQYMFTAKVFLQHLCIKNEYPAKKLLKLYPWLPWSHRTIDFIKNEDLSNEKAIEFFKQAKEDMKKELMPLKIILPK